MAEEQAKDFDYCESLLMEWVAKELFKKEVSEVFPEYTGAQYRIDFKHNGNFYHTQLSWEKSKLANYNEHAAKRIFDATMKAWLSFMGVIYSENQKKTKAYEKDPKDTDAISREIEELIGFDPTCYVPKYDKEDKSFTLTMINKYHMKRTKNEQELVKIQQKEREIKEMVIGDNKEKLQKKEELLKEIMETKIAIAEKYNKVGSTLVEDTEKIVEAFNKVERPKLYISTFKNEGYTMSKLTKLSNKSYEDIN